MIELVIIFVVVILIIILSAIMSGTEAALLSLSVARIKEYEKVNQSSKKKLSKIYALEMIKQHLQYYISVLVVLNNVVNIMGSILVGYLVTQFFGEVFLGAVTAVLTFGIIIFSEVIPKVVGERRSLKVSLLMTPFLRLSGFILRPIIFIIEYIVKKIVRNNSNENISKGEIREMAILGTQEGSLDNYEGELIDNIFDLNETYVYDIMVPRHKILCISLDSSFQEIISLVKKYGYTRFPVEKEFEIIGYIHIKDLLGYVDSQDSFNVKSIMRQLIFVPEVMRIVNVEKKLKSSRQHMCGIVNEHGEVIGIVTFEDIVEEIFGEISDEHDLEVENEIVKVKDGVYQIVGDCDIVKLNEELDLNIDEQGDYSTLNGFIIDTLERLPLLKEEIKIEEGVFRILSKNKKKILKVEFERQ
ncbi:MAG: hemolysin family protein [Candidatus Nanoarchaeia archaeon]